MKFLITIRDAAGAHTYHAVGNLGPLLDAAYDAGALGITVLVQL